MIYVTRLSRERSVANLRERPTMDSSVVSSLLKSAVINVAERRRTTHEGLWFRVGRGWALSLFLTPFSGERRTTPAFLSFDPRFERLRNRLEDIESLVYVNTQSAADEGSRLYLVDPERGQRERASRAVEQAVEIVEIIGGGGGPDRGMVGIERNQRLMRMREFEQNVVRYRIEARNLLREIVRIRQ